MKKKIILLSLLALMLTACDLNSLLPSGGNNQPAESRESSSVDVKKLAFKVADFVSVFPEVGDELDMSDYVQYDAGTGYKLEDFTFESTKPDVISIANYKGQCLKEGYCGIKVGHPDLGDKKIEVGFWVGSIAGNYKPDSGVLKDVVALNIAKNDNGGYSFNLNITPTEEVSEYNKRPINAYEGGGSLIKNISPFLPMNFEGAAPSSLSSITSSVSKLVPEAAEFEDLAENVYGFMTADEKLGVILTVSFNEFFIELLAK